MVGRSRRRTSTVGALAAVGALVLSAAGVGATTAQGADRDPTRGLERVRSAERTQLVTVDAPSRAARTKLARLGLDVTEAGTARGVDVVLHGRKDADALRRSGFTWTVRVADLDAQQRRNVARDRAYAQRMTASPLPSGRDHYRTLADYDREMHALARRHPGTVKLLRLKHRSLLGRPIWGIELSHRVRRVADGKPVVLMLGAHHAREWPSAEHAMEFAYDLLRHDGKPSRATSILDRSRVIVVPVVNVDGFAISRSATPKGDFSLFDYEMKRKNCRVSSATPADYRGGSCEDNPAGRLRGTDLNRNYPGFWGGPGASADWSDDTYRGDAPGSEPEVDNIRSLISHRQVTALITNHTFGDLVLRPPSTYGTGLTPDETRYAALGAKMTAANGYANERSYQLYDTSGGTEDWSYWNTGGFGFTFEIGTVGFHPAFQDAVVDEYLGRGRAAGAGKGGNREAYYRLATANLKPSLHATITGRAPAGRTLSVRKQFTSLTAPVILADADPATTGDPIAYRDRLSSSYASRGGRFSWAVNPSTRPVVVGRDGRAALAPPQPAVTLVNPPGVPAVDSSESATFTISGLPEHDNGAARVQVSWPGRGGDEAVDWDVTVYNAAGEAVGSSATLADPEVALLIDPVPGTYRVEVTNYAGGSAATDWSGRVDFESPQPRIRTGIKEAWMMTCQDRRGRVLATRPVVVGRGRAVDVGNACREPAKR